MKAYKLYIQGRTYGNNPIIIEAQNEQEAYDKTIAEYVDEETERFSLEEA